MFSYIEIEVIKPHSVYYVCFLNQRCLKLASVRLWGFSSGA